MNWMQNLYLTYDNCKASIGYADEKGQRPLLPICHITSQAHLEIVVDEEGSFRRARVILDKTDSTTIIPCSEGSGSRSGSKPENHPLCDKLQYVAGDFLSHGGVVTSGFEKSHEDPFQKYLVALTEWCESDFAHPKAIAVLKYVQKMNVVEDLKTKGVLFIGSNGKFLRKEEAKREKNSKDIFSVIDPQEDAFVRWVVEIPGEEESRVWRDKSLWNSWINFYLSTKNDKGFCFVTGEDQVIATSHPKYIRREGDGAKLISSNDTSGFTFRGRFLTDGQACGVGLEASQKSHYAFAWLISRQGYRKGDLAIIAWATSGVLVPQPTDDPITLLFGNTISEKELNAYTAQEIALPLKNRIAGYGNALGENEKITVMAVDSATPGRLSITYYRELKGSDFLQRIDGWHETCAWLHRYREVVDAESGKKRY
ncbi:MAG: type I-C CRISPR-associated protein Cas8c/Csd1, partial [Chloroflexi bacterium]|nr:type I-C CRISPR-associated protein Cas8c/Csd1 [Chloroflexota bacterium]